MVDHFCPYSFRHYEHTSEVTLALNRTQPEKCYIEENLKIIFNSILIIFDPVYCNKSNNCIGIKFFDSR